MVECLILHPLSQRNALITSAKPFFLDFESDHDSFRFSLFFIASFWKIFVEPGAASPVQAENSGTKLLCSKSRILCW